MRNICYNIIKIREGKPTKTRLENIMRKYRAYTQENYFAEKFDILDRNDEVAEVEAESWEEAKELFEDFIYETSLYSREETEEWLKNNPISVYEV